MGSIIEIMAAILCGSVFAGQMLFPPSSPTGAEPPQLSAIVGQDELAKRRISEALRQS
jgi:hypothetical protein